jgi:putative transposase
MSKCSDEKRAKIKQSNLATKEKRKHQRPMVFELKIDYSHLNKTEIETLKMFFVEAKWLYNDILSTNDPFSYDYKNNKVTVLNKDRQPEERILKYLPAKNKQDVLYTLRTSIKGLSVLKEHGKRVGKLKFKSDYNSIELSQYGITHKITGRNRIKINGIKKALIVRGLDQILPCYELANAKLVKKPSGYYIKLTCYKEIIPQNIPQIKNPNIGLDFGIKTTLTTSNGEKLDISIGESDRLKHLQKKLSRCEKGSKNRYKTRMEIGKEYEYITNCRKDKSNKIVSKLLKENQIIVMQDENISGWHSRDVPLGRLYGKQVQYSALGTIKSKLELSKQVIIVDRFFPSTKKCYVCGNVVDIALSERVYNCDKCGLSEDRDIKAAKSNLYEGLSTFNYIPMEHRDFKLVEMKPLPAVSTTASFVNETRSP